MDNGNNNPVAVRRVDGGSRFVAPAGGLNPDLCFDRVFAGAIKYLDA